ncbi:MAG: hypothetical protein R2810_06560 [Flavobacteriales bacterium]
MIEALPGLVKSTTILVFRAADQVPADHVPGVGGTGDRVSVE